MQKGCIPKSTTNLGWLVKIKWMQYNSQKCGLVPLKVELVQTEMLGCQALQVLFDRWNIIY